MPKSDRHEQKFLNALRDIFVGAKIEGESGYINLMKIKSRYYTEGVFPQLMRDIDAACRPFDPAFREELFDKLHDFFGRYFSESGSIYFRHTAFHHNVYERVYTDDRDVMLFWKTHMLYYVKTDRLFNTMDVAMDGQAFRFDVAGLEHKRANEKRELIYELKGWREGKVVLAVAYSERGRKTKSDDILRELRKKGVAVDDETLARACRVFEKQSEVDYFINKNARAFLREQFDLWLYQYVFSGDTDWKEARLRQLGVLKEIANKIIDFIAQFEDELVRVWNKPKFVLNSHYVITLDKITDESLRGRLFGHAGMAAQLREWRDLGLVDESFAVADISRVDLTGAPLQPAFRFLPLDTRHFPDLELDILALFDDLDEALDGWLVHSENYQGLNTLGSRFENSIACIYIDPPYNADDSEILYENDYRSSTWLTLVENRIGMLPSLLNDDDCAIAVAIDDYEMGNLVLMLKTRFPDYEVNSFIINHHPQGTPKANISRTHEYCITVTRKSSDFVRVPRALEQSDTRTFRRSGTGENNFRYGRPNSFYALLVDKDTSAIKGVEAPPIDDTYPLEDTNDGLSRVYPIDSRGKERVWRKSYSSITKHIADGTVFCQTGNNGSLTIYERVTIDRVKPTSNWYDSKYNAGTHGTTLLTNLFNDATTFPYPKSLYAVLDMIDAIVYENDTALVLDFFAGSGTTAHAVINLNRADGGRRKYILIEMGEHFNTVILPRVKKVVYSDKWKDGKAQPGQGISHFVKYYDLEQYEDTLRRAHYDDAPLLAAADAYGPYAFLRDLRLMKDTVTLDGTADTVNVRLDNLYPGIDLAETLSNVTGKGIRRITRETVEFQDGTSASLAEPDWNLLKPLLWW